MFYSAAKMAQTEVNNNTEVKLVHKENGCSITDVKSVILNRPFGKKTSRVNRLVTAYEIQRNSDGESGEKKRHAVRPTQPPPPPPGVTIVAKLPGTPDRSRENSPDTGSNKPRCAPQPGLLSGQNGGHTSKTSRETSPCRLHSNKSELQTNSPTPTVNCAAESTESSITAYTTTPCTSYNSTLTTCSSKISPFSRKLSPGGLPDFNSKNASGQPLSPPPPPVLPLSLPHDASGQTLSPPPPPVLPLSPHDDSEISGLESSPAEHQQEVANKAKVKKSPSNLKDRFKSFAKTRHKKSPRTPPESKSTFYLLSDNKVDDSDDITGDSPVEDSARKLSTSTFYTSSDSSSDISDCSGATRTKDLETNETDVVLSEQAGTIEVRCMLLNTQTSKPKVKLKCSPTSDQVPDHNPQQDKVSKNKSVNHTMATVRDRVNIFDSPTKCNSPTGSPSDHHLKPTPPKPKPKPTPEKLAKMRNVCVEGSNRRGSSKLSTISAFTTEDLDLFQKKSPMTDGFVVNKEGNRSFSEKTSASRICRKDIGKTRRDSDDRTAKRRSKSLGPTQMGTRLQVVSKPEIPTKPNHLRQSEVGIKMDFNNRTTAALNQNESQKTQKKLPPVLARFHKIDQTRNDVEHPKRPMPKILFPEVVEEIGKASDVAAVTNENDRECHKQDSSGGVDDQDINDNRVDTASAAVKSINCQADSALGSNTRECQVDPSEAIYDNVSFEHHRDLVDAEDAQYEDVEYNLDTNTVKPDDTSTKQMATVVDATSTKTDTIQTGNVSEKDKNSDVQCRPTVQVHSPVYENCERDIYGNIEIKKNEAGRIDLLSPSNNETYEEAAEKEARHAHHKQLKMQIRLTRKESRKLSRKLTRKRLDSKKSKMAETQIQEDEEEELYFSGSDSDVGDEDSFTDESDQEYEQKLIFTLSQEKQLSENIAKMIEENDSQPVSKLERVARELLSTEKTYVDNLHIVDQIFHFQVVLKNREYHMFPEDVIPQMFSNIKSIYQFHHDFILPQLEKRMSNWDNCPKIGDVMLKFAPFLKLYTDYVKNFDHAMTVISAWNEKSKKFAELVEEIQSMPQCHNLSLQHHMLGPIQRVPRYELLLKEYLKHLPDDSEDEKVDTEKALKLVSTAASHSNEAMRKLEKFRKLLDINESLGGAIDLISPTRELIKEGRIVKISARNGDHLDRYIFLFNDLLLVCQSLPVGIRQLYRIKSKIGIEGMQVLEGDNLETPNTFYVRGKEKTIEFHTSSHEDKVEWQVILSNVLADHTRKQLSRKAMNLEEFKDELGKRAPTWVKDQNTSMCMLCSDNFTTFKRRHHCRACGKVVCGRCSNNKVQLAYDMAKLNRVCDECYNVLAGRETKHGVVEEDNAIKKRKKILQVKAADASVICGYLNMSCDKKMWHRRFFAIHDNFVMYSFKAHQDIAAFSSLPLPGYQVQVTDTSDAVDKECTFKVYHPSQKKYYFFQAEDKNVLKKWLTILESVVLAELPNAQSSPYNSKTY